LEKLFGIFLIWNNSFFSSRVSETGKKCPKFKEYEEFLGVLGMFQEL
jgi:hypothetical protein